MSWTHAWATALAAAVIIGDFNLASAQVRVGPGGANVQAGGVNVRAGGRGGFRLWGRRPWFGNANVRRQLKIDDNQYNTLNQAYVQHWTPYNKVVVDVPANPNDQYRQKVATAYGEFNSGLNAAAGKVFTDAQLRDRYNQLNLQYQGYAAFQDPAIQKRLRLTDEQLANFDRYYKDWNDEMNTYAREYATDREAVNKRFGASWRTHRDRINETLTDEQRRSWNEMTGEPYDFSADVYFDEGDDRGDRRDDGDRDNPRREDPPRNPAPGAGPRENPPRNPAPGGVPRSDDSPRDNPPRDNPPRNPAPGGTPRGDNPPANPR